MTIQSFIELGDSIFVFHQHMLTNEAVRKGEAMHVWNLACAFEGLSKSIIETDELTEAASSPITQAVFAVRFERLGMFEKKWPGLRAKIIAMIRNEPLDERKMKALDLWNSGKSWPDVQEEIDGRVPELLKAFEQEIKRFAKENGLSIRKGKPGRKRN